MKNIFKSLFRAKKKKKPLSEDDLISHIDSLKINGYKLPESLIKRIKNDLWKVPKDKRNLKELIIEKSPFEEGTRWLDQMINDFILYPIVGMKGETEYLVNWLDPKWEKERAMLLGVKDEKIYPGNIEPDKVILFADFGLGSDTSFGLDYREDKLNPIVVLEYWGKNPETDNRWKKIANTYAEFEERIWK